MAKGKITPLTKTDVESLLPRKVFLGVSPRVTYRRRETRMSCFWWRCPTRTPAWPPTRRGNNSPSDSAGPHRTFGSRVQRGDGRGEAVGRATPRRDVASDVCRDAEAGGVYKFGGETATLELLKKFADEAFKKQNRRKDKNELNKSPVATHRGGRTRHPMDRPHASSEYYRGIGTTGGPVGAVVDASVQGAANVVARMAAPLAIISLVVGFFMATALRILDLAFGESSAKVAGSAVGGSASAAAARLAAVVEESGDATTYPGTPVDSRGRAIAPARGEAEQRRGADEAGEGTRGGEGDAARAALRDEDAIPSGRRRRS